MLARFLAAALLVTTLNACGGSGPATRDGATRSRPITLTVPFDSAQNPLTRPPTVVVQARAVCADDGTCSGMFIDFRNPGGNDLFLNYTPVTAEVDGEMYQWPEIVANEQRISVATGVFLRLALDPAKFRRLAFAEQVTFYLGSTPFEIDFARRATFRELIDVIQQ